MVDEETLRKLLEGFPQDHPSKENVIFNAEEDGPPPSLGTFSVGFYTWLNQLDNPTR